MANQVAARLSGDDYQHLYAWWIVLQLRMPQTKVRLVTVEDELAASVDDVTILHELDADIPDKFYQLKYHVDQRDVYSTKYFISHKPGSTSFLQKFWDSWRQLTTQDPERKVEIHLVSNWTWDSNDKLKNCISGQDNSFTEDFFEVSVKSDIGKLRESWKNHIGADETTFKSFIRCLRLRLGYDSTKELEERVSERMDNLGLKSDINALFVAIGIIKDWIKNKVQRIDLQELESILRKHDLLKSLDSEKCITIYLMTIKNQEFDLPPDHRIDWRHHFVGTHNRGHQLNDPNNWNSLLLPELQDLEEKINMSKFRLIKARGLARLSVWFAFGYTFSEMVRYTIEIDQQEKLWRTSAKPNPGFILNSTNNQSPHLGEPLGVVSSSVAVGISITGPIEDDVREYFAESGETVSALLFLQPNHELGRDCFQSAGDVVAFADQAKIHMRNFCKYWKAKKLLLFYYGPLSGACFLGHKLNAVCSEIQIMENQQPGYAPSFLFTLER